MPALLPLHLLGDLVIDRLVEMHNYPCANIHQSSSWHLQGVNFLAFRPMLLLTLFSYLSVLSVSLAAEKFGFEISNDCTRDEPFFTMPVTIEGPVNINIFSTLFDIFYHASALVFMAWKAEFKAKSVASQTKNYTFCLEYFSAQSTTELLCTSYPT